jgi:hypothetical protein
MSVLRQRDTRAGERIVVRLSFRRTIIAGQVPDIRLWRCGDQRWCFCWLQHRRRALTLEMILIREQPARRACDSVSNDMNITSEINECRQHVINQTGSPEYTGVTRRRVAATVQAQHTHVVSYPRRFLVNA